VPAIETHRMTDDALKAYDEMMLECALKLEKLAPLAVSIWQNVLKELDRRGKVRLVSGSYDDVGNAIIQRM
jgi:hypothetical protein